MRSNACDLNTPWLSIMSTIKGLKPASDFCLRKIRPTDCSISLRGDTITSVFNAGMSIPTDASLYLMNSVRLGFVNFVYVRAQYDVTSFRYLSLIIFHFTNVKTCCHWLNQVPAKNVSHGFQLQKQTYSLAINRTRSLGK